MEGARGDMGGEMRPIRNSTTQLDRSGGQSDGGSTHVLCSKGSCKHPCHTSGAPGGCRTRPIEIPGGGSCNWIAARGRRAEMSRQLH